MATNANAPPLNNGSPESLAPEDSAETLENELELDGPLLSFPLVEDVKRKDQLFFGGPKSTPPSTLKPYRPSQNQLLGEGKGWESIITARLNKVIFGTFEGKTACLVMVQVNFAPKNHGFFRFRNAKVELEFKDKEDKKEHKDDDEDDYDDNDDDDDGSDDDEQLLVRKFDPEHIRGHIQTATVTRGVIIGVTAPPPVPVGVSAALSFSAPREGQHLVQGFLITDEKGVKWIISENEISKSGIFELVKFAVIVRYREERGFVMKLSMEATTHVGGALKSKGGSRIAFNQGKKHQKGEKGREGEQKMSGLIGGSIVSGGKTWTAETDSETSHPRLDDIDLESMTEMKARLLSEQGPGGGQGRGAAAMLDEQVDAALTQ